MDLIDRLSPDQFAGVIAQNLLTCRRNVTADQIAIELKDHVGAVFSQLTIARFGRLEPPLCLPQWRDIGHHHKEAEHLTPLAAMWNEVGPGVAGRAVSPDEATFEVLRVSRQSSSDVEFVLGEPAFAQDRDGALADDCFRAAARPF